MGKTALLVIDMQLGVFMRKEYDGMAIYREERLLGNLQALIEKARTAGAPVLYIQHLYRDFPLMEKGQPLWNVHPSIAPAPGEAVIEKEHADAFWGSALQSTLEGLGATDLVVTGIQTAYCVDTTCRRAHSLGYRVVLVSDGHSTLDSGILPAEKIIAHHNEVLASQFVTLQAADEVTF